MATAQELFDEVVKHLRAQGKQSLLNGSCAYRGEDGFKCAIGCLISDKEYHKDMEGGAINDILLAIGPPSLQKRLHPHLDLLIDLQCAHDWADASVGVTKYWEEEFQNIADKFKLIFTPVKP